MTAMVTDGSLLLLFDDQTLMTMTWQKRRHFQLAPAEVTTVSQKFGTPVRCGVSAPSLNSCEPFKCHDKKVPDKLEGKRKSGNDSVLADTHMKEQQQQGLIRYERKQTVCDSLTSKNS